MKTVALPIIWFLSAAVAAVSILIFAHHVGVNRFLAVGLAWGCSIYTALFAGRLAVRIKPDLRFSTRQPIDGLGYLHEPFGVVVNVTIFAVVALITLLLKR